MYKVSKNTRKRLPKSRENSIINNIHKIIAYNNNRIKRRCQRGRSADMRCVFVYKTERSEI